MPQRPTESDPRAGRRGRRRTGCAAQRVRSCRTHRGPQRVSLDPPERVCLLDQGNPAGPETAVLARRSIFPYPRSECVAGRGPRLPEALGHLESLASRFLVHFDVDAIDFVDFPTADVPQFNAGLAFEETWRALASSRRAPDGLVVTQFNPDHADEEGVLAATSPGERRRAGARQGRPRLSLRPTTPLDFQVLAAVAGGSQDARDMPWTLRLPLRRDGWGDQRWCTTAETCTPVMPTRSPRGVNSP